jgi:hypothetical protein
MIERDRGEHVSSGMFVGLWVRVIKDRDAGKYRQLFRGEPLIEEEGGRDESATDSGSK